MSNPKVGSRVVLLRTRKDGKKSGGKKGNVVNRRTNGKDWEQKDLISSIV